MERKGKKKKWKKNEKVTKEKRKYLAGGVVFADDDASLLLEDGGVVFVPADARRRRIADGLAAQFDAVARLLRHVRQPLDEVQRPFDRNNHNHNNNKKFGHFILSWRGLGPSGSNGSIAWLIVLNNLF